MAATLANVGKILLFYFVVRSQYRKIVAIDAYQNVYMLYVNQDL